MIKVLIVDDHQLVRTGLVGLLEQEPGIQVIGESASGEEAVRAVDEFCLLYTSPSPRDTERSRMPSSA